MPELDPYAPPGVMDDSLPKPRWFRRDGNYVVVRTGAVLPGRCVKTNDPIGPRDWIRKRQLAWFPKWARFAPLVVFSLIALAMFVVPSGATLTVGAIGVPLILIASMIGLGVQKRLHLTYALSRQVRRRRMLLQSVALVLSFGGWIFCEWQNVDPTYRTFLIVAGCLAVGGMRHPLRVSRHRDGEFWLKGASPAFLDSLEDE